MVDAVVAHARRDHPDECCGIIAGRDGVATRVVPMTNAERSPTGFVFDPQEQLTVWRGLDDADEDLLVVYHSHTMTEAYPSRTDVRWSANTPGTSWLLVYGWLGWLQESLLSCVSPRPGGAGAR